MPFGAFEVRIFYNAQPRRGLYFIQPSRQNPAQKRQTWTLNAPGATRYWIPVLNAPNDMLTSEVLITADSSRSVFSNGRRVEEIVNDDGSVTTYFRQDKPHTPHHLMLALGDYEAHRNTARFAMRDPAVSLSYRVVFRCAFSTTHSPAGASISFSRAGKIQRKNGRPGP